MLPGSGRPPQPLSPPSKAATAASNDEQSPSPDEVQEVRKQKLADAVVRQVTDDLKKKFWAVFLIIAVLGYFGANSWIKSEAQSVTKDLNHTAIAEALVKLNSFNTDVITTATPKIIDRLAFKPAVEPGNSVPCTVSHQEWENGISSIAKCPAKTIRISGGCEFTCLGGDHTISVPFADDGWQCRLIARGDQRTELDKSAKRTFRAVAVCLSVSALK